MTTGALAEVLSGIEYADELVLDGATDDDVARTLVADEIVLVACARIELELVGLIELVALDDELGTVTCFLC